MNVRRDYLESDQGQHAGELNFASLHCLCVPLVPHGIRLFNQRINLHSIVSNRPSKNSRDWNPANEMKRGTTVTRDLRYLAISI